MPQYMNAFSGLYCNEQLLLPKSISEEAIKRKLFDYKSLFPPILNTSFIINIDLLKPLDREKGN